MTHQCDPLLTPEGAGPLTNARVHGLLLANWPGDPNPTAIEALLEEVAGCGQCQTALLVMAASVAAHLAQTYVPNARMSMELQLAAFRAAGTGDGGP